MLPSIYLHALSTVQYIGFHEKLCVCLGITESMAPRAHHRPQLRRPDTRGWREARHFVTEKLIEVCAHHGIDPESTMHMEYTITGEETTTEIYELLATARRIRMPVAVYVELRSSSAFEFAKECLKRKAILVDES
jgi:hypothetical protein